MADAMSSTGEAASVPPAAERGDQVDIASLREALLGVMAILKHD